MNGFLSSINFSLSIGNFVEVLWHFGRIRKTRRKATSRVLLHELPTINYNQTAELDVPTNSRNFTKSWIKS